MTKSPFEEIRPVGEALGVKHLSPDKYHVLDVRNAPHFTGEQVRAIRLKLGMSRAAMGDMLSISKQSLSKWEQGSKEVHPSAVKLLQAIVNFGPEFLIQSELPPQTKAVHNAFDIIRTWSTEELEAGSLISSSDELVVTRLKLGNTRFVAKVLVSSSGEAAKRFQNELHWYEQFAREEPPFATLPVFRANEERGILLMKQHHGKSLATSDFPAEVRGTFSRVITYLKNVRAFTRFIPGERTKLTECFEAELDQYQEQGILLVEDLEVARALGENVSWKPEFAHGNASLVNALNIRRTSCLYIDWANAGAHVPLFDFATLWVSLVSLPDKRLELEKFISRVNMEERFCFLANCLLVTARELAALPKRDESKREKEALSRELSDTLEKVRLLVARNMPNFKRIGH